ncbi:AraC family transcriptional regulator [Neolewinella xylanilytica]|uniref:AraC family transcriptional regulator n=1 Tax=Neolewinella xylanilytica TaxID=1514080 RepID=A0A2S6I6D3_9BACT|nr:response regulator transcription factor [Neolewinella xylanilytica]PPK87081.1 AraC family transcriptional regulator [Neolewinella xylanilytica]
MPLYRADTISQYHANCGLPPPAHPLVSVARFEDMQLDPSVRVKTLQNGFYLMGLKRDAGVTMKYGRQAYDFDQGLMFFTAPGQAYTIELNDDAQTRGWLLMVHPDFLYGSSLAEGIHGYEYFGYAVHEALHLSGQEEDIIRSIIDNIRREFTGNLDEFSQDIVVTQLTGLLNYAERFYRRQFLTRKKENHALIARLEETVAAYFRTGDLANRGLPAVQEVARALHVSPGYLSEVLRVVTGHGAQEYLHARLVDRAKTDLAGSDHTVSEIAYGLGFRHPQSFSKFFKTRTGQSPSAFRDGLPYPPSEA